MMILGYSYKWFINEQPNEWINTLYRNHILVSASGGLYFSSVTKSDVARYYCSVSLNGGTVSRTSAAYNLIVDTSQGDYFTAVLNTLTHRPILLCLVSDD